MVFILQFVTMVYHTDLFLDTETALHPCDKPHWIMVYDSFNILLDSVCQYFVEDFCTCVHQCYWHLKFFFGGILVWFWYQGDSGLIKRGWECSFLCNFLRRISKEQAFALFDIIPLVYFLLHYLSFWGQIKKKSLPISMSQSLPLMFSCRSFMVSDLTFESFIHFELIIMYGLTSICYVM